MWPQRHTERRAWKVRRAGEGLASSLQPWPCVLATMLQNHPEVSHVKPPLKMLTDGVSGIGGQRSLCLSRFGASAGKFQRLGCLHSWGWKPLEVSSVALMVDASCQMAPQLRLNSAPTCGLFTQPGLPLSSTTSGQSDSLQGRAGPRNECPRDQGHAASTLLT